MLDRLAIQPPAPTTFPNIKGPPPENFCENIFAAIFFKSILAAQYFPHVFFYYNFAFGLGFVWSNKLTAFNTKFKKINLRYNYRKGTKQPFSKKMEKV